MLFEYAVRSSICRKRWRFLRPGMVPSKKKAAAYAAAFLNPTVDSPYLSTIFFKFLSTPALPVFGISCLRLDGP